MNLQGSRIRQAVVPQINYNLNIAISWAIVKNKSKSFIKWGPSLILKQSLSPLEVYKAT